MQRLDVEAGLAAERALLEQVHRGERDAGVLLWRPLDRALVMPARMSRLPGFEAARARCEALDWPVSLRDTGGEPVPQSPGVLNIALAYAVPTGESELTRIETAYLRLCRPVCDWLAGQGLEPGIGEARASWWVRPSAGAAAARTGATWCWCTGRCWWRTSVKRWWRWSMPSIRVVACRIAARPRATWGWPNSWSVPGMPCRPCCPVCGGRWRKAELPCRKPDVKKVAAGPSQPPPGRHYHRRSPVPAPQAA